MICAGGLALAVINSLAGAATVYRCESAGRVTYSDRPCAPDAVIHESDGSRVTVYDAQPISKRAPQSGPRVANTTKSVQKSAAAAHAKWQASCAKLDQSLREVRTKLRTGYGVKEGERLKARQRQLAERRRAEKCR